MAGVSGAAATFLLTWLCWWAAVSATYAAILFSLDALLAAWQRRQQVRRCRRVERERIDREAAAAVGRIGAAFVVAQRLILEEAAAGQGGRR